MCLCLCLALEMQDRTRLGCVRSVSEDQIQMPMADDATFKAKRQIELV